MKLAEIDAIDCGGRNQRKRKSQLLHIMKLCTALGERAERLTLKLKMLIIAAMKLPMEATEASQELGHREGRKQIEHISVRRPTSPSVCMPSQGRSCCKPSKKANVGWCRL